MRACCLLAKPGRSTLDPKEDYKAKTSSTNLVTLALALTQARVRVSVGVQNGEQ